jgi:hypothetical protein
LAPLLSALIPLAVSLFRASSGSQWRDDQALLAAVGEGPAQLQGLLSSLLMGSAMLLPIGGQWLRATAVSACGAAAAGWLICELARRLGRGLGGGERVAGTAGVGAAWLVTLSPAWQLESTVAGGLSVACALAIAALLFRPTGLASLPWLCVLLAAAAAERWAVCLAGGLGALSVWLLGPFKVHSLLSAREGLLRTGPWRPSAPLGATLLLFPLTLAGLCLGELWRSGGVLADLGDAFTGQLRLVSERDLPLVMIDENLTLLVLPFALLGLVMLLTKAATRAYGVALLGWCLLGAIWSRSGNGVLGPDPLGPFLLLGLAAVGLLAAAGACFVSRFSLTAVPWLRIGSPFALSSLFLLSLLAFERSGAEASRRDHVASEAWTDQALSDLPHASALLLRSPELALRLWAARELGGQRPDLLVVPLSALGSAGSTQTLLALEPELAPVIRDMRLSRRPSEYSLSSLSDRRALFVQFDPGWDPRLRQHLKPFGFWMQFSAHALGRSDRSGSAQQAEAAFDQVLRIALQPERADRGTLAVVEQQLTEQKSILSALHDQETASRFAARLAQLPLAAPQPVD